MNAQGWSFQSYVDGTAPLAPIARLLGWEAIEVDQTAATVRLSFAATNSFLNPVGTVQGGILCAMLDETMSGAVGLCLAPHQVIPTIEMQVRFVRPALPGRIVGTGRVLHRGNRVCHMAGELSDLDGNLLAVGTGSCMVRTLRPSSIVDSSPKDGGNHAAAPD